MKRQRGARKRLGEILLEEGLVSEYQLAVALGQQRQYGGKLGRELVQKGFISEDDLCSALERQLGVKWLSLRDIPISHDAVKVVKYETVKKFSIMPVAVDGATCTVAIEDPKDLKALDTLAFVTGKKIKPVLATLSDISWAIGRYYEGKTGGDEPARLKDEDTELRKKSTLTINIGNTKTKDTLFALLSLLIEKGYMTEEELLRKIREQPGS